MENNPEMTAVVQKEKFRTPLSPKTSLKDFFLSFREDRMYLLICFALPVFLMLLMYFCMSVYHGSECVLVLDLNGQYVSFFEGLRKIIYGDGNLLYSFRRALGGEFIGIFAYYLSSPFSFLVALFPENCITEAILTIMLLKTGCCGLTFGIYMDATRPEKNRTATVIFSTMYALCGYCIVMQHNTMWFDNVLLLPIIMLGIENLIKFGKFKLYVIALSMAVFSNFYIGYMTCIFSAVYFIYYMAANGKDIRNPRRERYHTVKSFGRMALFSVIAVMICAALIMGTYYSLTLGKTTFSNPNFTPDQKFDWLDMTSKLFIGSYDTVRPEGLPFIFSGTLTLILLPLYFFAPHIKGREKIASGCLMAFFLISFNITTLDLFWHGMQKPNWLNYRYSYMLCFFMILFAAKAFERLREIGYKKAIAVCAALVVFLIFLQKQEFENVGDFETVWLSVAIIAVYLCVMWAVSSDKEEKKQTATLVLAVLVSTEMFGAGLLNKSSLDDDVRYTTKKSYRSYIDAMRPVAENVLNSDKSFYRMEKTDHRKTNDNFAFGMRGLSNSTSTLNSETIAFLHDFGLTSKSHWSQYSGGTPVSDSLFGLKYLIAKKDTDEIFESYQKTEFGDENYDVWQNDNAMSIAAAVSSDIDSFENGMYNSPFKRMNAVVTAMLGEEDTVEIFRYVHYAADLDCGDLITSSVAGHDKFAKTDAGYQRLTFSIKVTTDDVLYCYFPSEYKREAYLYVNGKKFGSIFGNETDHIIELGSFEEGDTLEVALEPLEDEFFIMNGESYFFYLDSEKFEKYMPRLCENNFEIEDFSESSFKGKITATEERTTVYTSIPYDEGWNIFVDGERISPKKLMNGVIGFDITPGEHTLKMNYFPMALTVGLIIQASGLAAFVAAWIISEKKRKKLIASGVPVWMPEPDVIPDETAFEENITTAETNAKTETLTDTETEMETDTDTDTEEEQ